MSDRALTFRDQIHVLDSHKVHDALQGSTTKDQQAISSELVPNSDKIMYVIKETKQLYLLFKRDAGRRNCCPLGIEQLRDCNSANFVSKDLMLLEMRRNNNNKSATRNVRKQRKSLRFYWTMITIDEQVKELDKELYSILCAGNYTRIESRIVKGNIC